MDLVVHVRNINQFARAVRYLIEVKDKIQFAYVLERAVQRLYKDLVENQRMMDPELLSVTCIRSRIPSSLSAASTTKTKYSVA